MEKILRHIEEKLSVIVYSVMLIITFSNVIGRYFLHASISFTDEITTNLFVLVCVIGTGIAARERAHLGLSIITELIPRKAERLISVFANLCGAFFGATLIWTGCNMVQTQLKNASVTPTLQWPSWVFGIFLPIGAVFITVRFLQAAYQDLRSAKNQGTGGDDQ